MNEDFVRDKLASLLTEKHISFYKASKYLGHGNGYIGDYVTGRQSLPMAEFFSICEYIGVTPSEFFDTEMMSPHRTEVGYQEFKKLNPDVQKDFIKLFQHLNKKNEK